MTLERIPYLSNLIGDWLREKIGNHDIEIRQAIDIYPRDSSLVTLLIDGKRIGWIDNDTCEFECSTNVDVFKAADPLFFDKIWKYLEKLDTQARIEMTFDPLYDNWLTAYIR